MSRWFRHYAGMMRDEKLVRVAVRSKQSVERVIWVWGAILESAAEINDNGRYEFDAGEASYFLRCETDEIDAVLAGLEHAGRLVEGVVAKWGERQFSSDAGAERQRRYRERKNAKSDDEELQPDRNGDGHVTSRDGTVTPPYTETDTDTEKKKERLLVHSHPERDFFSEFWLAYPRREGPNPRKPAKLSFERLLAKGASPERIVEAARALAIEHPSPTRFVPQAVTWLNQERFGDEEPLINGDEFCPDDWPNTRVLKIRFRDERGHDPPEVVHGGKTGVFLPAEWVALSRQANGTQTTHRSSGIRGEGEEVFGLEGPQERGISDRREGEAPSAVAGLDRLLSIERHAGFRGADDRRWQGQQDGPEPISMRLRS